MNKENNMRELKFRAYNTYKGWTGPRMSDPFELWAKRVTFGGEALMCAKEDLIVMQFTGLKDCSNSPVDIYEGDIIKVTHFSEDADHEDMISEVIFESGVFALKQRHIDEGEVCPLSCEEHYVVIGNVWENPELLKAAQ